MWLKMETLGPDRHEATQAHGTSVLSTQGIVEGEDEPRADFDVSDEDEEAQEEDEDSGVADLLRARNRPPSLPTVELTSVIAVRKKGGPDSEMPTKVRGGDERPPTVQARRSEPIFSSPSSAPRRMSLPPTGEFGSDESRKQTVVRGGGNPLSSGSPSPRHRLGGSGGSGGASLPPLGDATKVHPPSQAGFARGDARSDASAAHGAYAGGGGSPLAAAVAQASAAGPARRLPTSGVRPRPAGHVFEGTQYIRRPRRIIGIMIVLLLIGIGVALGVAFSGPELEVVDPTATPTPIAQPPNPAGNDSPAGAAAAGTHRAGSSTGEPAPTATGTTVPGTAVPGGVTPSTASGSAAAPSVGSAAPRQAPPPAELPSPPSATPGTP